MKLLPKKLLLISIFVIIFLISYPFIKYIITGKGDYLFIQLSSIFRKENMGVISNLNLPEFQLIFSENDIAYFADLYKDYDEFQSVDAYQNAEVFIPYYQKNNKRQKAILLFENQKYDIKIKSHGTTPALHKDGKYISFNIKLLNNHKIYNVSKFRLIIYWRNREYYDFLHNLLIGTNIIFQQRKLVLLKINDWDSKLYYFELDFNQKYFSNYNIKNKIIFEKGEYKSLVYSGGDTADFRNIMNEFIQNNNNQFNILKIYNNFNDAIIKRSSNEIINFLDFEYITTLNALRLITKGDAHGFFMSNLLVCFDTLNHKFYPVFHRDFTWNVVVNNDNIHWESNTFGDGCNSDLFFSIDANDSLRRCTYKKIYDYITGKQHCKLISNMDSIINFHESLYYSSKIKNLLGLGKKEFISNNIKFFKDFLEDVKLNINYFKGKDKLLLEIEPNSKSFLSLEELSINNLAFEKNDSIKLLITWLVEGEIIQQMLFTPDEQDNTSLSYTKSLRNVYFFDKLDINSRWKKSTYRLIFILNNSNPYYNIKYVFKNRITDEIIPTKNILINKKEKFF